MKAKEIMDRDITAVTPDFTIGDLVEILVLHRVSGLPVVDDECNIIGFVSEKDIIEMALPGYATYLRKISFIPDGLKIIIKNMKSIASRSVREIMKSPPIVVDQEATGLEVAHIMFKHNIRRIPVVKDGKLVGMVSRANLLFSFLEKGEEEL